MFVCQEVLEEVR